MMHSCCCIYFILRCGIYFIWIGFEFLFEKGFEKQINKKKEKGKGNLPAGGSVTGRPAFSLPALGCEDGPLPRSPSRRWAGPGSQAARLILLQPLTGGPQVAVASPTSGRSRDGDEHRFQPNQISYFGFPNRNRRSEPIKG
jgi:hypothetical protein